MSLELLSQNEKTAPLDYLSLSLSRLEAYPRPNPMDCRQTVSGVFVRQRLHTVELSHNKPFLKADSSFRGLFASRFFSSSLYQLSRWMLSSVSLAESNTSSLYCPRLYKYPQTNGHPHIAGQMEDGHVYKEATELGRPCPLFLQQLFLLFCSLSVCFLPTVLFSLAAASEKTWLLSVCS